ncbi:MAG: HNH endonuclease signature motif containing protein [Nocardioidaceae bacterium]
MSSQRGERVQPPGSPGAVLAFARSAKAAELAAGVDLMVAAVEWAAMHEPVPGDEAAWFVAGEYLPIAGEGAPLVAEFAVAEFAAAVGLTTDAGKVLVGRAVEIAHRLPKLWKLVKAGRVAAWQARRVADHTLALNKAAAGFVDEQVAAVAGKIGPVQLERLIREAECRHMPQVAQWPDDPMSKPDGRGVWIDTDQVSMAGQVEMRGTLDLGDALDLDKALAVTASQLKLAGSRESLDARRATALGEIARNQLALTFEETEGRVGGFETAPSGASSTTEGHTVVEERAERASRNHKTDGRPVTLYLHLSDQALTGGSTVGRCENTRTPIDATTVRQWCGREGVQLTVKPVIDLDDHVHVAAYEVPGRLKEAVGLRDVQCVFPWCTRPARRCDHDHVIPHDQGGGTCSHNIAALCRHHHRLKTLTSWRYKMPEPGVYVWTSPHGYVFLRDHTGTIDVTPAGLRTVPACPTGDGADGGTDPPES